MPQSMQLVLALLRLMSQQAKPAFSPLSMRRRLECGEGTEFRWARVYPCIPKLAHRPGRHLRDAVSSSMDLASSHFEELEAAHEAPRFIRVVRDEPPYLSPGHAQHALSTGESNSFELLEARERVARRFRISWRRQDL